MDRKESDEQRRTAPLELDREGDSVEERLMDDGETSQRSIVTAAQEGFVRDQENPDHPTRVERDSGVEDPSHSRGSDRHGPGEKGLDGA
jgi:hypothetical protein